MGYRSKQVLVTGGLGFLGSHLVRRLVNDGAQVHVLGSGPRHNLEGVEVAIHDADLRDRAQVQRVVENVSPKVIFHLAARVNAERSASQEEMHEHNVVGTQNLIRAAESVDYEMLVHTGTCEEYGQNTAPFTEDQIPHAVSPYAASKIAATKWVLEYVKKTQRPITILRPFLTYGPYQKNSMLIPYVITSLLMGKKIVTTRGEQTREFNFVADIVDGFYRAGTAPKARGEIINIGNGKEIAIKDVISTVQKLMKTSAEIDTSLPYRKNETMHFYCSNEKAKNILKWKQATSFEDGLRLTIDWYKDRFVRGDLEKWLVKKR